MPDICHILRDVVAQGLISRKTKEHMVILYDKCMRALIRKTSNLINIFNYSNKTKADNISMPTYTLKHISEF